MVPKLATPYHLLLQREQLGTLGFECPLALIERRGTAEVREAQADIVEAGVGRRADLGEMTLFPRFPPPRGGPRRCLLCSPFNNSPVVHLQIKEECLPKASTADTVSD